MDDDDLRRALDAHFEREIGRPPTGVRDRGLAGLRAAPPHSHRSEEHTSELQSQSNLVCRLLLEKKKKPDLAFSIVARHIRVPLTDFRSIRIISTSVPRVAAAAAASLWSAPCCRRLDSTLHDA